MNAENIFGSRYNNFLIFASDMLFYMRVVFVITFILSIDSIPCLSRKLEGPNFLFRQIVGYAFFNVPTSDRAYVNSKSRVNPRNNNQWSSKFSTDCTFLLKFYLFLYENFLYLSFEQMKSLCCNYIVSLDSSNEILSAQKMITLISLNRLVSWLVRT